MEYPNYAAEIEEIEKIGITEKLLNRIIQRHEGNARHTKELYKRYKTYCESIPIFLREPHFKETISVDENGNERNCEAELSINNKINNDFFSEIIDMKVGYFAGKPASYNYADDYQAVEETGGEHEVEQAEKSLREFVKRNNMFNVDMESTKYASICGYAGRLFYIDTEGNERVMIIPPYETIILYKDEMTEPSYAIRYYEFKDISDNVYIKAEFYDANRIYYYEGSIGSLVYKYERLHLFDYCPLQGIPNNEELMGDAEKVIELIDDYDRTYSDNSNDLEGFANAYMVFKNVLVNNDTMRTANQTGVIGIGPDDIQAPYDVSYLTKSIDGSFVNSHLDRAEDNIYRFSKSPNLNDPEFTAASGIALKIKMTGLETKCGTFEAKQIGAATYMFKLLASSFQKRKIPFSEFQCSVTYKRNFPIDFLGEAQAVQALIGAGLPRQVAFKALSFVDDISGIMRLIEDEKDGIPDLEDEEGEEDEGVG